MDAKYNQLDKQLNVPGTSCQAKMLLPLRFLLVMVLWILFCPLLLIVAILRALYLRIVVGRPSQILKYGTYNANHAAGMHYPCQQLYKEPLDEKRLREALESLCPEDGIEKDDFYLKFMDEEPNDWPSTNSWDIDHFIESNKSPDQKRHYMDFDGDAGKRGDPPKALIKIFVWNGKPGKPTVMWYFGSAMKWDGSSNFNFVKELMNRYMGNPPNKVFQKPEISPQAAAKFDEPSFICFLLKMPFNVSRNMFAVIWNVVLAAKWAGGNGFGPRITAMNFTKEESARLYAGCKKQGATPFAALTYAGVKAAKDVLKESPLCLTQQASLQTRHFPVTGQDHRDFVGDWLFGPNQWVSQEYGLKEAMVGYKQLQSEMEEIGPLMQETIMAKAYGLFNSGAAMFQAPPTYNLYPHCLNRCIFMNNYGIRKMPEGSPFHTWNWNAPMWLGINTINVDECTTTLIGSAFWGQDVVDALRDSIEATLRGIMETADASVSVPIYKAPKSGQP